MSPATVELADYVFDYSKMVTQDDTPLDSHYQERQQRLLCESLYLSWRPPEVIKTWQAGGNVGVFFADRAPAVVPDAYVSVNLRQVSSDPTVQENRSYFVWIAGKPPDIVVEMVSETPGGEDTTKLELYAQIGVDWYVIFDPLMKLSTDVLRVFERRHGELVPTPNRVFQRLGLGVTVSPGTFEGFTSDWLRWTDGAGNLLAEKDEAHERDQEQIRAERERVAAETERADLEAKRADQVTKQRDDARAEAQRLIELLRKAGIDPDLK
jgi:Uma2 family endonuclease